MQIPLIQSHASLCCNTGQRCDSSSPVDRPEHPSIFFAYPFSATLIERVAALAGEIRERYGYNCQLPIETVDSKVLFCKICSYIRSSTAIFSEVTELNRNVLFEHGFALALGLKGYLLVESGIKRDSDLDVLRDIERITYSNREDILVAVGKLVPDALDIQYSENGEPKVLGHFDLSSTQTQIGKVVLLKAGQGRTDGFKRIEKSLRLSRMPAEIIDTEEHLHHQLFSYCTRLKQSNFVIGHLVSDRRQNHQNQNALSALLLGLAVGFGKQVLIFQETPAARPMIDLGGVLHEYSTEAALDNILDRYLVDWRTQAKAQAESSFAQLRQESTRLAALDIGASVAENDDALSECFIETPYYDWAVRGTKFLIVGAKGAGKTAIFRRASESLTENAGRRVIALEPSELEMSELQTYAMLEFPDLNLDLRLRCIWRLNLLTQIASRIVSGAGAGAASDFRYQELSTYLADAEYNLDDDLITNFQRTLTSLASPSSPFTHEDILKTRLPRLRKLLLPILKDVEVRILADNLDKGWQSDDVVSQRTVLAFVHECFAIGHEFGGSIKPTLFLRSDILDVLKRNAQEPDKWEQGIIRWTREELKHLLEVRLQYAMHKRGDKVAQVSWEALVGESLHGQAAIDYLLDRTLTRPRDAMALLGKINEKAASGQGLPLEGGALEATLRDAALDRLVNLGGEYQSNLPRLAEVVEGLLASFDVYAKSYEDGIAKASEVSGNGSLPAWCRDGNCVRGLYDSGILGYLDEGSLILCSESFGFEQARQNAVVQLTESRRPKWRWFPWFFFVTSEVPRKTVTLHPAFRNLRDFDRSPVRYRM